MLFRSAQVMISRFVGSSPVWGSVLTAQSPEPALDSVSVSLCPALAHTLSLSLKNKHWGTWVAQLVKCPTLAQVMISQFGSASPASGFVLTAQSPEPALDSVLPSLCSFPAHALSLSLRNKETLKKN